jgi:Domain of unknown function (DUF4160)
MALVFHNKGLRFFFYSNKGSSLEPMHIHVCGSDGEAKFWLKPIVTLADSSGFDAGTLRDISWEVTQNVKLIERAWNEHFG